MSDFYSSTYAEPRVRARVSTATLFGQVMFLVGIALGFLVLGSVIGRDLSFGTARVLSFAGFGMLLVSSFAGQAFRVGAFAMAWLFATALMIGLGLGPVLAYFVENDPATVTQAAGGTALVTVGMGAAGFAMSKDLVRWMRPLSYAVLAAVLVSLVLVLFAAGGSPIISLIILGLSAALLLVDFNYLRLHAEEDDAIWLATGIFVSIVNIFLSLLNLFGRN
jgi:FtsH-binding integral membrane protein